MNASIILVGFMGAGKSVISQILGHQLGVSIYDLDDCIVEQEGKNISNIFEQFGEPYFRELESNILKKYLDIKPIGIIATGGGIVESEKNRQLLLEQSCVVWLSVELSTVYDRIREGSTRPLMDDHVEQRFIRRQDWYREVATFQVNCDDKSVESVAQIIINRYG